MNPIPQRGEVNLALQRDHALILFEFLSRYIDQGKLEIKDQAEQGVLWDLCGDLERILDEPLDANYEALLKVAYERVRDR